MKQRRIVCAAIRGQGGGLILGIRHYDLSMLGQLKYRDDAWKLRHRSGDDQGFVDQHGVYMTREEAYRVASEAGQILYPQACTPAGVLFSEALY